VVRSLLQPKHGAEGKYAKRDTDTNNTARRAHKDEATSQREEIKRLKAERRAARKEEAAAKIKEEHMLERERQKALKEQKKHAVPSEKGDNGRMRTHLVKGVRDKRDKTGKRDLRYQDD
jgi:hypothetical protein